MHIRFTYKYILLVIKYYLVRNYLIVNIKNLLNRILSILPILKNWFESITQFANFKLM